VEVGATQQRVEAMREGKAYGAMVGSEQAKGLASDGFRVLDSINRLYTHYAGSTAVRRAWAEANEALLLRYLRAHLRGARAEAGAGSAPSFGWEGLQEMLDMRRDVGLLRGAADPHRFADDRYFRQALGAL